MKFYTYLFIFLILTPGSAISGSIKGSVLFLGKNIQLEPHKTGKYKKACGLTILNESMLINKGKIKNVVVSLHGNNLKRKTGEHKLDQKKCRYEPHVIAMPVDSELKIHTSDPVNHNIHTYSFENDPMNIMFIPDQEEYSQEMEEAEIIKVECDLHNWMTAWIVVTPNGYSDVSSSDGTFLISNIPPGKYELTAWHETLGSQTKSVIVKDKELNINFEFAEVLVEEAKK
jgi:plastocyanin